MEGNNGESEVLALLGGLVDAWNRRDGVAVAGMFTPDADYVSADGEWLQGRHNIANLLRGALPDARRRLGLYRFEWRRIPRVWCADRR